MNPRFASFLVSAALVGCGQPQPCIRQSVDRLGHVSSPFGPIAAPELLSVGERTVVKVFAPITSCATETLSFSVELLDGDNAPATFAPPALSTNIEAAVLVEVPITPTTPGLHLLTVRFEPNLGARSVVLFVAGPANVDAGVVLPVASWRCPSGVWPLGEDAVVCATAQDFTVTLSDGGTRRITGRDIVTADETVWSVSRADQLERFELINGSLQRTHVWDTFGGEAVAGLHTSTQAVRRQRTQVSVIDVSDGGQRLFSFSTAQPPPVMFIGDLGVVTPRGCVDDQGFCNVNGPIFGLEADAMWSIDTPEPFVRAWPLEPAFDRKPTLLINRELPAVNPTGPFEILPLWVGSTLVGFGGGVLSASMWPRERVLQVGSRAVVLRETDASVRVVPR